jgi:hypothetical protein
MKGIILHQGLAQKGKHTFPFIKRVGSTLPYAHWLSGLIGFTFLSYITFRVRFRNMFVVVTTNFAAHKSQCLTLATTS